MNIIMNGTIRPEKGRKRSGRTAGKKTVRTGGVRITSGVWRGRALVSPRQDRTHPMGSRERLALFNAIGPEIRGKIVLDAFSGTGALGLEALSRGAAHVTFVEKDHSAAEAIRENIRLLKCEDRARVFECPVETLDFDGLFDLVIADPPYDYFRAAVFDREKSKDAVRTLERLAGLSRGRFILSHAPEFDPHLLDTELLGTRSYAGARISAYKGKA